MEESNFFKSIEDQKTREAFYTTLVAARENLSQLNVSESSDLNFYKDVVDQLQKGPQTLTKEQVMTLFDQVTQSAQACDYEVKDVKLCLGHVEPVCLVSHRDEVRKESDKALKKFAENPSFQNYHTITHEVPEFDSYGTYMLYSHVDNYEPCSKYINGTQKIPHERGISEEVALVKETVQKEPDRRLLDLVNLIFQANNYILLPSTVDIQGQTEESGKATQKIANPNSLPYLIKDSIWSYLQMLSKYAYPDPSNVLTLAKRNQIDDFWADAGGKIKDGRGTPEALAQLKEFMIDNPELAAQAHFENSIVPCVPIELGRKEFESCRVFGVNGIKTSEESARKQALEISDAIDGYNVHWIYNASQSLAQDTAEARRNINNVATEASYLLLDEVTEYLNNSGPESIAYIQCHSQGTASVKNMLLMLPEELRARVSILAIAPAAYINIPGLEDIRHYASRWDFVHLLDKKGMRLAGDTLIILDPATNAPFWDHAISSPTYAEVKEDFYENIMGKHAEQ